MVDTAATCDLGGVGRCAEHLIPDVVLALRSGKKDRVEELCRRWKRDAAISSAESGAAVSSFTDNNRQLDVIPGVGLDVLPSPHEPELVFLRTPTPTRLVRAFLHSDLLHRHFDMLFVTKHQANTPEELSQKLVLLCEEWQKQYVVSGAKFLPVQEELIASLTAKAAAASADSAAADHTTMLPPAATAPFSCLPRMQSYPKSMRPGLLAALSPRILMSPRHYTHVLFVVYTSGKYFFSLEPATLYVQPSQQVAAEQKIPPMGKQPAAPGQSLATGSDNNTEILSRAYHKMEESFLMDDALRARIKPGCRAIDLGASPGGWSSYLATARKCRVLAIDPGVVMCTNERVQHVAKLVEDSAEEIRRFATEETPLDLIVCDMNVRPELACQLIHFVCATAPISPTAMLVLTCKETLTGRSQKLVTEAQIRLSHLFTSWRSYHLLSNAKERTLIGQFWKIPEAEREAFEVERLKLEKQNNAEWETIMARKKSAKALQVEGTRKERKGIAKLGKKSRKTAVACREGQTGASCVASESTVI